MSLPFIDFQLLTVTGTATGTVPALYVWGDNTYGQLGDNLTSSNYYSWSQISIGGGHTIALRSDGTLWGWGRNDQGQVGDGTTINKSLPTSISALTSKWTSVSAGFTHSVATANDSTMYTWGGNRYGQLGIATTTSRSAPVQLSTSSWTTVSSGLHHTVGTTTGNITLAWGWNGNGQLGVNDIVNRSSPVQVSGTSYFNVIAAGGRHTIGIAPNSTLYAWGDNAYGQLGNNDLVSRSSPVQVSTSSWSVVGAGTAHSAGITKDNKLYTWGYDYDGQLGLSRPALTGNYYIEVEEGNSHTVALDNYGRIWAWGDNSYGQLGQSDTIDRSSPVQISGSYTSISSTADHAVAIATDGKIWGWGRNSNYQLGDGTSISRSSPVQLSTNDSWAQVSAGESHTIGLRYDGSIFGWGDNAQSQIGGYGVLGTSWTKIVSSNQHTLGIKIDGTLWGWGRNDQGQLGVTDRVDRSSPVQIVAGSSFIDIAAATSYSLAIRSDGKLFGWGANEQLQVGALSWTTISSGLSHTLFLRSDGGLIVAGGNASGQLGDGTTINRSAPVQIGTNSWSLVSAGQNISAGITSDGSLYTWGVNNLGQLGNTTTINRSSPVQVAGLWNNVSANDYMLGVSSNGYLYSWGNNNNGQLGINDTTNRSSPVQVSTDYSIYELSTGTASMIVNNNGSLYVWGSNNSGQLGLNDTINRSSPVQVGTSSWTQATTNTAGNTLGITVDGKLYAWGLNSSGQLGLNDRVNRSSPVQVTTGTPVSYSWSQIAAGTTHTAAIATDGTLWTWGFNASGQLGLNDTIARSNPTQVTSSVFSSAVQISAGGTHTAIISTDRYYVSGWGFNATGQLGDGTTINRSLPVQILTTSVAYPNLSKPTQIGISNWTKVESGQGAGSGNAGTSLGLTTTGLLYAWGQNSNGQLGDNSITSMTAGNFNQRNIPGSWIDFSVNLNMIGVKSDNNVYTWGLGAAGALGFSDTVSRSFPTQLTSSGNFVKVGALSSTAAALDSSGNLYVWGLNANGQLGTGDTLNRSSPVQVMSGIVDFSVGDGHIIAQISDQTFYVWGLNNVNALGLGDTISRSSPTQLGSYYTGTLIGKGYRGLILGFYGGAAMTGVNNYGQIGDGTITQRAVPTLIPESSLASFSNIVRIGTLNDWVQISAGYSHTAGLRGVTSPNTVKLPQIAPGILWAWGNNISGQLGNATTISRSSPTQTTSTSSFNFVRASKDNTFGLTVISTLVATGSNASGQLGDATTVGKSSFVTVGATALWNTILPGQSHVVGIRDNNTAWAWGNNNLGQLGLNDKVNRSSPVQIGTKVYTTAAAGQWQTALIDTFGAISDMGYALNGVLGPNVTGTLYSWSAVSTGDQHTLAVRSDGTLWTWGLNAAGQLGDASTVTKSSPVVVAGSNWASVYAGQSGSFGIKTDKTLWAWGFNSTGQLGIGDTVNRSSPVQVSGSWNSVASYISNTYLINSDYTLWGTGAGNILGDGLSIPRSSPVQIDSGSWASVVAGLSHGHAIKTDGSLYSWGNNSVGSLGIINTLPSYTSFIIGGSNSTGAILGNDGSIWTWGGNSWGQIGANNILDYQVPYKVGGNDWSQLVHAGTHLFAIKNNGTLWAWGYNDTGRLGTNDTINRSSPVQVPGSWTNIYAGDTHAFGVQVDGTVWSWGGNTFGNLLLNDTINRSSPTLVSGYPIISNAVQIKATDVFSTYIIDSLNKLWAFGLNDAGKLGIGVTQNRSSPVQVAAGTSFSQVAAGTSHAIFLEKSANNYIWVAGLNTFGQLGTGDRVNRSSATQITSNAFASITASLSTSAGITTSDQLVVWGVTLLTPTSRSAPTQIGAGYSFSRLASAPNSTAGQTNQVALTTLTNYNNNSYTVYGITNTSWPAAVTTVTSPTFFPALDTFPATPTKVDNSSYTQVSTGASHSLAISSDGKLIALGGNNTSGQLGVLTKFTKVFAGTAVREDGTLYVWGRNLRYELGLNDAVNRSNPVQVSLPLPPYKTNIFFATVEFSDNSNDTNQYRFYIDSTKNLYAIGYNIVGQLGLNNQSSLTSFTKVGGSWVSVDVGHSFVSYGVKADGTLWAWGGDTGASQTRGYPVLSQTDLDPYFRSSPAQIGTDTDWSSVYAGDKFGVALKTNGSLYGWGLNNAGQLGDKTPVSWAQVSAGLSHAVGRRSDGKVFVWGNNVWGQLGLGDTTARAYPALLYGGSAVTQVAAFYLNTALLYNDGTVRVVGVNSAGQLGVGDIISRSNAVQISGSWTSIFSNIGERIFLKNANNLLFATGSNTNGQLGLGDTINRSSPTQVGTSSWSLVTGGLQHNVGVTTDGKLFAWGLNTNGRLGTNDTLSRSNPVQIDTVNSYITAAAGADTGYGIKTDGTLWSWGNNASGQLGLNDVILRSSPVQVGTSTSWSIVGAGSAIAYGLDTNNILYGWGYGANGALGNNSTISRSNPVQIATSVSSVTVGNDFVTYIDTNYQAYSLGLNAIYQTGTGTGGNLSSPVQVFADTFEYTIKLISSGPWSAVSVARHGSHVVAKNTSGILYTWGYNFAGQLALGDTIARSSPTQVNSSSYSLISAGQYFTAVTDSSGNLWGAGYNVYGQLGLSSGNVLTQNTLVSNVTALTATENNTQFINSSGGMFGLGYNVNGELGNGTTINRSLPTQIASVYNLTLSSSPVQVGTSSWTKVNTGTDYTIALLTTNTLFGWGLNSSGQIGLNDTINRSSPVQIGTFSSPVQIAVGTASNFVLDVNGNVLYAWGTNASGQLFADFPNGSTINRSSPVQVSTYILSDSKSSPVQVTSGNDLGLMVRSSPTQVGSSSAWMDISLGDAHTVGMSNFSVFTWGKNNFGQLGVADTINRSSPVQVSGYNYSLSVDAGQNSTNIISNNGTGYNFGDNNYSQLGDGT